MNLIEPQLKGILVAAAEQIDHLTKPLVGVLRKRACPYLTAEFRLDDDDRELLIIEPHQGINPTVVWAVGEMPLDVSKLRFDIPIDERLLELVVESCCSPFSEQIKKLIS